MSTYYLTQAGKEKFKDIIDTDDCVFRHIENTEFYCDNMSGIAVSDDFIRSNEELFMEEKVKIINDFITKTIREDKDIQWIQSMSIKEIKEFTTNRAF